MRRSGTVKRIILLVVIVLFSQSAQAQERKFGTVGLEDRRIAHDPRFAAVGRLNLAGTGFCSATLIAPALALTAAHCLFYKRTGKPIPPDRLHFVGGFRKGKYRAHRRGRAVSVHEDFMPGVATVSAMRHDIAVVILEKPVPAGVIRPLPLDRTTGSLRLTVPLTVVSYARDRAYLPSVERGCVVWAVEGRLLFTDCDTNFGASGSSVLTERDGTLRVLGIISGIATVRGNLRRTVAVRAHEPDVKP